MQIVLVSTGTFVSPTANYFLLKGKTMTRIKTTFAMLSMIAISALASQVQANEYHHIEGLAQDIETKSKLLYREMVNYRQTPQYRHVRSDALELKRLGRQIHAIAEKEGSIFTLESCLNEMDALYHHTAELIDQIDLQTAYRYGRRGETCVVTDLMVDLEDCIHQMRADVAKIRNRTIRQSNRATYAKPVYVAPKPAVVVASRPVYVPSRKTYVPPRVHSTKRAYKQPYNKGYGRGYSGGNNRGGISIGSGGLRVNFKF